MVKIRISMILITVILLLGLTQPQVPLQTSAHVDVDFVQTFGSTDLSGPRQVTGNDTHLFITSNLNDFIRIYDLTGTLLDSISSVDPTGIIVNDTHIIANDGWQSLKIYDHGGTEVDTHTNTSVSFQGMTSNESHIIIGDTQNHMVNVYDRALNHVDTIGSGNGNGDGEFSYPERVHMNGTHIFVADNGNNRVQIFDLAGVYLDQFDSTGAYGITTIDDHIVVTDESNDRVNIYDSSGNFIDSWGAKGSADGTLDRPRSAHSNGTHIFISEQINQRVTILDFTPATTTTFTETSESLSITTATTTETTTEVSESPTTVISTITEIFNDSNLENGDSGVLSTIALSTTLFGSLVIIVLLRRKR